MADNPTRTPVKLDEGASTSITQQEPLQPTQALEQVSEPDLVEERRSKVFQMRLRGHKLHEIATLMGVSVSTVKSDLKAVQEESKKILSEDEKKHLIYSILSGFDDIMERAWSEFEAALPGSRHRLQSLDLIRLVRNDKLKALQETGIIEQQTQKIEQTVQFEVIQNWTADVRQEIARALIEHSLTKELPAPIPEENIIEVPTEVELESSLEGEDKVEEE